ncbi:3-oxo-5-alpha-steroid 4-dehydrogenase 1-like [Amphiura filiformis]|uniref:3-oxo-5-alpha-steroid 4-dehydrogenase 1-like n=1 Tax=Amphiura filiformis TaxID=82378 RepID=UPI003B21B5D5
MTDVTNQVSLRVASSMASETEQKNETLLLVSFLQDEEKILINMSYAMLVLCFGMLYTFWATDFATPYGRYANNKYSQVLGSVMINANFAWVLQELPHVALPIWCVFCTDAIQLRTMANVVLVGMVILHYIHRTFIYSLSHRSKPTRILSPLLPLLFCIYNGYLQGRYLTQFAVYETNYHTSPNFIAGCIMFACGMLINIQSDNILKSLRKPGEIAYKIPRGGMFDYISGANFFGESLEWMGYAVACWNLPAFAFAIFTISNIGPRAFHHHKFYKEKFEDYPPERKAFIPFLL